jgi:hypothetical protein
MHICIYVCMYVCTAIPIIIEGQFQVFQRFSKSKLVLKAVESCFVALNYYGNGSMYVCKYVQENNVCTYARMHKCMYVCM